MFAHLEFLSSDELRGRFTFSDELGVAADYIAEQYTSVGVGAVGDSYRMPFKAVAGMRAGDELTIWVESEGGRSRQISSRVLTTLANGKGTTAYADVVIVASLGRAKAAQVRGKVVIAPAPPVDRRNEAIGALEKLRPAGLLFVGERPPPNGEKSREVLSESSLPVAWVDRDAAREWVGLEVSSKGELRLPKAIKISMAARQEPVQEETFNVLAMLPGHEHPEQIVILGAHYDHIGTTTEGRMCRPRNGDEICNGADDNASGTAMVLEIAQSYAAAGYRPARTVVFAHFSAEELGLHGSRALSNSPPKVAPFVGGQVVAMVNLDMVGRLSDEGLAIGGLSSSDAWMPLLESVEPPGLSIVYERAINGRSDHANFYRKKIPVLFFFTGLHDDYHQVGDHVDKINREGMVAIGQMVADLTRALADGADVPYAPPRTDDEGIVSRMPGSKEATVERRSGPSKPRARPSKD
ncbi:MAG: M20/M25/M40 family metallo-hydrolase [Myxococcota bacterium]